MPPSPAVTVAGAALTGWLWLRGTAAPEPARPGAPAPGTITIVAGGVGGPGPATRFPIATCPISSAGGALYAGDGAVIRRIDARTGWLTTPAGDGTFGTRGNGGPAAGAELNTFPSAGIYCATAATLDAAGTC